MRSRTASGRSRLQLWRRVREYAVPLPMIESATARRAVGDWAGACAAARVDVDLDLRSVARTRGREFAAHLRDDLRHLAPDLLRWHLPRIAPDGLLRPGLTIPLARYGTATDPVHLVARTPPGWADAGQRISLALWDNTTPARHPHPHPSRRYRLDLHRHLWDARRAGELRHRCGADHPVDGTATVRHAPPGCAVHRWPAEAAILLRAEGLTSGAVTVKLGAKRRLLLHATAHPDPTAPPRITAPDKRAAAAHLVLPDAATWTPPDLELLRAGLIDAEQLHPLVAPALVPDHEPRHGSPPTGSTTRRVDCRGNQHRLGLVDGVLTPLDHDPGELHREQLLAELGGTPLPCLQVIDAATRHPESLPDIRARLDHGDTAGALAAVEHLLGPDALLRDGPLLDELHAAARRRIDHGRYRSGLVGLAPPPPTAGQAHRRNVRTHPRHATYR